MSGKLLLLSQTHSLSDYCFMRSSNQTTCIPDPECLNYIPNIPPSHCPDKWLVTHVLPHLIFQENARLQEDTGK